MLYNIIYKQSNILGSSFHQKNLAVRIFCQPVGKTTHDNDWQMIPMAVLTLMGDYSNDYGGDSDRR